jgi:hypothetical protein
MDRQRKETLVSQQVRTLIQEIVVRSIRYLETNIPTKSAIDLLYIYFTFTYISG